MFDILDGLASAKNVVTGQADATRVKDAEGNNLPTQTTSRLYGSL
jgi:hypothetical protein